MYTQYTHLICYSTLNLANGLIPVEKSGALGQFDSMDVKGCGAVSHKVHVHTTNWCAGYNIFFLYSLF